MSSLLKEQLPLLLQWLKRGADIVGALFFLCAFCLFILQVFFRYVLNDPLAWTEEGSLIAFIWAVFWAAAFMVPIKEHVTFDVVYEAVSEQTRRILAIVTMLMLITAFVLLIPYTFEYLQFMSRKKSSVLRVPMHLIYGCYILFIPAFAIQAAWRLSRLFGRDWQKEI